MEEKEKVENLEDDFEEIKDMQKTQALKKIEEEKYEKEEKVPEKKGHPLFVTFLIIILLAAFTCMGFFGGIEYYKNSLGKEDKDVINDEEEEIIELEEDEINKYFNSFSFIDSYFNTYLSPKYPLNINDLSNQDILNVGLFKISSKDSGGYVKFPTEFSQAEIEKAILEVFGSDFKFTNENINCFANDGPLYEFNNSKYSFYGSHGHGGRASYRNKSYFIKAYKNDTKGSLDIEEKILYGGYCGDVCGPILNFYKEASLNAKGLYSTNGEYGDSSDYDKAYNEFKDQLPITTFHFEKDSDGNYGLKSIKVK